ncbi:auxin-responsive protein SAUR71-like [Bidens hawaiensis]|uniref:auxin-responsive protein SAUR71-like n=1 Tax=Bidens hawaiensis TaxID=980011 RepID=UPI004049F69C
MEYSVTKNNNFIVKTWRRCRSFPRSSRVISAKILAKSKSWNGDEATTKKKITPKGFFPVYVGPDKQRFAVKTKHVNHPLFSMLLEDVVTEYGYYSNGPILLPCDVDMFYKVLAEMEVKDHSVAYGSCSPFNPSRRLGINGGDGIMGKGYGSFEVLAPSTWIKMN